MTVGAALVQVLRSAGVRYVFGNPGTTELSFLDALPGSGLEYVLALQEASAVAAADGYAQAAGAVGVVNLHAAPGSANGLAIVHNAARARTPLVVTAGQQDSRLLLSEPILAGDMVRFTEPFTKWSYEVRRPDEAAAALRRALKVAATPPAGPVFLSLPMDIVAADLPADVPAPAGAGAAALPTRAQPDAAAIVRAADLLLAARSPAVVAGDGVARAGAVAELVDVVERLGAPVHGEPIYRRTSFPGDHALWRGGLYPTPTGVRRSLDRYDAVLVAGASVFTWFLHAPGEPFPPGCRLVQLDDDPWEIGKNHPVTLGVVGDVRASLAALARRLAERGTAEAWAAARARTQQLERARADAAARLRAAAEAERERTPISPAFLMHTLAPLLPADAVIVDESASTLPHVLRHLPFPATGDFFGSKTGTLGWAPGAAVGVQLAWPRRKVVATVGDGALMYAPQALWTAARYRLPITYVVPNNASYAILKSGMLTLGLASAARGDWVGLDLVDPEIDYVALARGLGVRAERVEKPGELADTLAACLRHPGPSLVDVAVEREAKAMR